jgi:HTH-type transcriptional regulator / antitoxin HigA
MPVMEVVDEKKYGRLLAKYLPCVIRSDEEHDRLAGLLMKLSLSEERSAEEERLIELLEQLVDDYDARQTAGTLEALAPVELLRHLMEEGGLKQVDLVDCFGSQSVVSSVMAGKRQVNLEHARRLWTSAKKPPKLGMGTLTGQHTKFIGLRPVQCQVIHEVVCPAQRAPKGSFIT